METETTGGLAGFLQGTSDAINTTFSGPLSAFFHPINDLFSPIPAPIWRLCAIGLFITAMIFVFALKERYVNLDQPRRGILFDLRLWTVVSMLPHVIIYLVF